MIITVRERYNSNTKNSSKIVRHEKENPVKAIRNRTNSSLTYANGCREGAKNSIITITPKVKVNKGRKIRNTIHQVSLSATVVSGGASTGAGVNAN